VYQGMLRDPTTTVSYCTSIGYATMATLHWLSGTLTCCIHHQEQGGQLPVVQRSSPCGAFHPAIQHC